ncbi:MAG: septum formation inhibitor Maf [Magnetococcales bacterium]|nr:septum formation inhibitor Maf [Magnetococcales bacterium]
MRLRLASASERRRTLLEQVGLRPEVHPTHLDETRLPGEEAEAYVERLSLLKAAAGRDPNVDLVLGADTAVVLDGEILGKPADQQEAEAMLSRLSGRPHRVLTGVTLLGSPYPQGRSLVVESGVWIKKLSQAEIRAYVASGEPMDKAGAYGIQGLGAFLVARVEGSWSGVAGLPLYETLGLLASFGLTFAPEE